jgi:hypothetical protein
MTKLNDLHNKWLHDPNYRAAYDALDDEFTKAAVLIEARTSKKSTPQNRKSVQ